MTDTTPPVYEEYSLPNKPLVYGNVLDKFDNYTYNARLYMIPDEAPPPPGSEIASSDARTTSSETTYSSNASKGGFKSSFLTTTPNQTYVLAQTGVTGTQIDNIEILSATGPGNSIAVNMVNFDIIQPGAADFLDQIVATKAALGLPTVSNDVPMFLEIVFKGYTHDVDDADAAGKPATISGPFIYKIIIKSVDLTINAEGSTYAFACVPLSYTGYADENYRMPKMMQSGGSTIDDHITSLVTSLNLNAAETNTAYQYSDIIEFDLSGIKKETNERYGLSDLSLSTTISRADDVNRVMNPDFSPDNAEKSIWDALALMEKNEGPLDIVVINNGIAAREGITLARYLETILSMNDEFYSRITRKIKPKDPSDLEVDKEQAFVSWYRLHVHVELLRYDNLRNAYARKITYKPIIYGAGSTVIQDTSDTSDLTATQATNRIDKLNILKAYHYLFTGRNDQIINCDISYKAGMTILLAPSGGATGDASTVLASTISNTATPNADLTGEVLSTLAKSGATQEQLKSGIASASEGELERLVFAGGQSRETLNAILGNRTGVEAQAFARALADKKQAESIIANAEASSRITSSDNLSNSDGTQYNYSVDLLKTTDIAARLDSESALASAQQSLSNDVSRSSMSPKPAIRSMFSPSITEDASHDGTPRNTLFSYLSQQHAATSFLISLDMQIRGDPWYLGSPVSNGKDLLSETGGNYLKKSTEKSLTLLGDDTFVYFDMQAPRRFDLNTLDEDANTGYWSRSGTAYFISGIYRVVTVANKFSGGLFSQDLHLIKETGYQADVIQTNTTNAVGPKDVEINKNQANIKPNIDDAAFDKALAEWEANGKQGRKPYGGDFLPNN